MRFDLHAPSASGITSNFCRSQNHYRSCQVMMKCHKTNPFRAWQTGVAGF